ncbi:MAG: hypothetical protein KY450_13660, partial [Actinobacteria bacterium]|nr:hypothetical protein [Actinomycetota bacterium]
MPSATRLKHTLQGRAVAGTLLATAGLLVALAVVSRVFYRLVQLDEAAYSAASITLAALGTPTFLVLAVPAAGVVWLRRDLRWSDVVEGRLLRVVVLAAAGSLIVSLAFYEPNWYFDRSHLVDRALLVGLFALSFWRPIALVPFTVLAAVVASQFAVPLGRYTWNDKRLIFDVVILFCLAAGAGLPAYPGPVLVAVDEGGFAATLDAGDVQLSEGGGPGTRPEIVAAGSLAVRAGDALFFPRGMEATPPL